MKRFFHAASPLRDTKSPSSRRPRRAEPGRGGDGRAVPWWKSHTTIAAAVTATIAIVVASCGSAPADTAPASPSGSDQGAELYQSNCASCHGADLSGTETGPSHLSIVYEPNHHGDDAFKSAVANGAQQHHWDFGDMPAITGLDDDEIDAIISYVRSEQERQGFEQ